jgi:LysM repeat protein
MKVLLIAFGILLSIISMAIAGVKPDSVYTENNRIYVVTAPSPIDISYNEEVQAYSELYQANENKRLKTMLEKGNDYFEMIERILSEEGLPTELKYLAYIESNFNTRIMSRAGARGMWQFMRGTAVKYGLSVNKYGDERCQPEKATKAAAAYFKKLFAQYNDWNLVIAAYNCGEGALSNAMNRAGNTTDFWQVYNYLPRETRKYVPHFLGIVDAMNSYNAEKELNDYLLKHGVIANTSTPTNYSNSIETTTALVSVDDISTETQSLSSLSNTNLTPETSNTTKPYNEVYLKEYFVYVIKQGDSIEGISKKFPKNTISIIKENNNLNGNADLSIGSTLLLEK